LTSEVPPGARGPSPPSFATPLHRWKLQEKSAFVYIDFLSSW